MNSAGIRKQKLEQFLAGFALKGRISGGSRRLQNDETERADKTSFCTGEKRSEVGENLAHSDLDKKKEEL